MRLTIAAIGRMKKAGPEDQLVKEYLRRLPWEVTVVERESAQKNPEKRKDEENALLIEALASCEIVVALDERGKLLSSEAFAQKIGQWKDTGAGSIGFAIGGADGLNEALRAHARLALSLSAMTWPHMLARALLAEQLYRAHTILTGHPYHRA